MKTSEKDRSFCTHVPSTREKEKRDQNKAFLPTRIASCSAINNKTAKQILVCVTSKTFF